VKPAERLRTAISVLTSSSTWLRWEQDLDDLSELLTLREMFRVPEGDLRPVPAAARNFGLRCGGQSSNGESIGDAALELLTRLDANIQKLLDKGADDNRIIRTKDFAGGGLRAMAAGVDNSVSLAVGLLNSLPDSHRLRKLNLADANTYFWDGLETSKQPCLILGPSLPVLHGASPPRAFYFLNDVLHLTANFAYWQRKRAEEQAEANRLEEVAKKRAWSNSPLGKLQSLQAELDRLKEEGQLPTVFHEEPAVRGHNPVR
jgi:hypothetical protein